MTDTCKDCKFYYELWDTTAITYKTWFGLGKEATRYDHGKGLCKRRAPKSSEGTSVGFPAVDHYECCGEYEAGNK